ncbi:MAG TPA: hypothetical protein VE959_13850 [Bryobacteraceae bacterium]|nr:hypothetical protein [Bryobacteraceae bacterium]
MKVGQSNGGPESLSGAELASSAAALREHLREVLESPAFRGSRRCQQFLRHIVEKAIGSHYDDLKERTLGVELFGRSPAYDTGEDAIVRVTASDVRKRLHQFYAETTSAIRIDIPSGSYAPEFRKVADSTAAPPAPAPPLVPAPAAEPEPPVAEVHPPRRRPRLIIRYAICAAAALALLSGVWLWSKHGRLSPRNVLPWSDLFRHDRPLQVIFADPDISTIQDLLGFQISLSEYANRQYVREIESVGPDLQRALKSLRGVNVPIVDAGIALDISALAGSSAARLKVHPARALQLRDVKTDDDFVVLGSPHSNPWTTLFQDQMDFDFIYDANPRREAIRNKRPRKGELGLYVPTAGGWDTGQAFAVVAFVGNPSQTGHVLVLAGTNAEGTEAAGKLVTNLDVLSGNLWKCGVDPAGPAVRFELLLEVRTMAGASNTFDVIACHQLQTAP